MPVYVAAKVKQLNAGVFKLLDVADIDGGASSGLLKWDGDGNQSFITDSSGNWNNAYTHSQIAAGNPHGTTYSDVGASAAGHTHDAAYLGISATAADSDKLDGQHGSYYAIAGAAPAAHQLNGALHTVSGLTTGHFLKATGTATFAFGVHGLAAADVGAAPTSRTLSINSTSYDLSADRTWTISTITNANDALTNATMYPLWSATQGGTYAVKTSNNLTYNPSTGRFTAVSFGGDGSALTGVSGEIATYANQTAEDNANPSEGHIWYRSDLDEFRCKVDSTTKRRLTLTPI